MANSVDPDQLATLFAKAQYIRAQQDKGLDSQISISASIREMETLSGKTTQSTCFCPLL